MNKKIIAILLVFTLVITCFVACKRNDYEVTKIGGIDYPIVKDDEGNTIVNEDYQMAFYVTDANGDFVEDEDGEPQTNWVQLFDYITGEDMVQDTYFKMKIGEGWSAGDLGRIVKDDTDGKCYMGCVEIGEVTDDFTLDSYLLMLDEQNQEMIDEFNKAGCKAEMEKSATTVTIKNLQCITYKFRIEDTEGNLIHYAENLYYVHKDVVYKLEYICMDGIGYDEEFNFEAYIIANFTAKG